MPSYLITGASRGLGLEFVNQLSANPENIVFGLVRNQNSAPKLLGLQAERKNVHVVEAEITKPDTLRPVVEFVSKVTGGKLDVLINNAAFITEPKDITRPLSSFEPNELVEGLQNQFLVNCTAQLLVTNIFLPLIKKSTLKKVIIISSGVADVDFTNHAQFIYHAFYCISKSSLTIATAKYALEFKEEGVIFLALSPGMVNTAEKPPTEEEMKLFMPLMQNFSKAAPDWKGPLAVDVSVKMQLDIIDKLTLEDSGKFIGHNGDNKRWL
jgi:NAD(P)-dependent dehydrogenase (short-subunit alcohol dehydrogenase family)